MKYIGIGNCDKYNIYILIAFLSDFFKAALFGLNTSNAGKPVRIFPFKAKIRSHNLLNNFIRFASIFFGGVILFFLKEEIKRMKSQLKNMKK